MDRDPSRAAYRGTRVEEKGGGGGGGGEGEAETRDVDRMEMIERGIK